MVIGGVTAALGVVSGVIQIYTASDKLGVVVGAANAAGSLCQLIACIWWLRGAPVPQLQALGMALMAVATLISLAQAAADAAVPGTSRMASAIFGSIERCELHREMIADPSFKTQYDALKDACTSSLLGSSTALPLPRRNVFVVYHLRAAGFRESHIFLVMGPAGATIMPMGGLGGAPTQ